MELASRKSTLVMCLLFLVIQGMCGIDGVDGATEVCGKNPSALVDKLSPCRGGARQERSGFTDLL